MARRPPQTHPYTSLGPDQIAEPPTSFVGHSGSDHNVPVRPTMSDQPVPVLPVQSTPQNVVFRMITPVFSYKLLRATRFAHSGDFETIRFEVELRPYWPQPTDWGEVTKYASDGIREMLRQRVIHLADHGLASADHMLVADAFYSAGAAPSERSLTRDGQRVLVSVIDALRLHSSGGLPCHKTYEYVSPSDRGLGDRSVLRVEDFDAVRATADLLMRKVWNDKTTFDKVVRLAMEYHRLAFTLERVEHAFLILMVAFEALFKKDDEGNASRAAQRIGKLLGASKSACQAIQREVFDDPVDSFCRLRNRIAHGDPNLDVMVVANKYLSLYRHLTAAVVSLLHLPGGTIDGTKDYYDEVSRYAEARFMSLPST